MQDSINKGRVSIFYNGGSNMSSSKGSLVGHTEFIYVTLKKMTKYLSLSDSIYHVVLPS